LRLITLPRLTGSALYLGYLIRSILALPWVFFKRYDIIHSFAVAIPSTSIPVIVAGKFTRKKILIDWDDAWAGGLAGFTSPLAARTVEYLENNTISMSEASGVTVVSEYLRERAESLGNNLPVYKVLNGSDNKTIHPVKKTEARKECGIPKDELVLMSMGRTYTRSFDILLGTFEKVVKEKPEAKLYIVGQMCEYGVLKKYIEQTKKRFHRLLDKIVFVGTVKYDRLKYYLSAADMLLLPMEDCPHDEARFPIRFGDYISSGNLIVSNAVGEIKTLIERYGTGITAHPTGTDDFAEKILSAMALINSNNGTRQKARELATGDLSWSVVAGKMNEVYQRTL
ncbi:MAG: glycosyltransferase, partial [Nitrospinota bacterium]